MKTRSLALMLATAALLSACASKESKPEPTPTPAPQPVATSAPLPDQPMVSAAPVDCKPGKNTKAPGKGKKGAKPTAADCPAPDKAAPAVANPAPPAATVAAAPAASAPAASAPAKAEAGKPRIMKSRDGTFEGEVYGNIPAGSKWSRLIIGMEQAEVERILGGTSNEVRVMPTGKAFIPFYYGTDRHRYEVVYRGQGSVSYTGGSWGGGRGVLMMINYDPNM